MLRRVSAVIILLLITSFFSLCYGEEARQTDMESAMSETLELWREGRYEQLYDRLAKRTRMTKETFVKRMEEATVRPSCCWRKLQEFSLLSEKRTEAVVYAKIGLEGTGRSSDYSTREYRLSHDSGQWKMQLSDITSMAGLTAKKGKRTHKKKQHGW